MARYCSARTPYPLDSVQPLQLVIKAWFARDPGVITAVVFGFIDIACLVVLVAVLAFCWRKTVQQNVGVAVEADQLAEVHPLVASEDSAFSGSGSGLSLLMQRTVVDVLLKSLGKGSYGEVWVEQWHGGRVAVRISESWDHKFSTSVNAYLLCFTVMISRAGLSTPGSVNVIELKKKWGEVRPWVIGYHDYQKKPYAFDYRNDAIVFSAALVSRLRFPIMNLQIGLRTCWMNSFHEETSAKPTSPILLYWRVDPSYENELMTLI